MLPCDSSPSSTPSASESSTQVIPQSKRAPDAPALTSVSSHKPALYRCLAVHPSDLLNPWHETYHAYTALHRRRGRADVRLIGVHLGRGAAGGGADAAAASSSSRQRGLAGWAGSAALTARVSARRCSLQAQLQLGACSKHDSSLSAKHFGTMPGRPPAPTTPMPPD